MKKRTNKDLRSNKDRRQADDSDYEGLERRRLTDRRSGKDRRKS